MESLIDGSGEKILILGLGNILLKDEGVGVHAVEALKEGYDFPENVRLIDGGTMGLDLLPFIEGKDKVLIIDAADFKEKAGTIKSIEGNNIPAFLNTKFSVHQIGLPDMLFAAKLMGITPTEMCLIGMQPQEIDTGLEMSRTMKNNFPALMSAIINKVGEWGIEIKCKKSVSD
ncbi:MAG: HyaD/HybD family hydrogenase maturation endopeptidase [Nitrospirae bacterium]|nr:HyaD/HybD family hydrogenase maturation endopeptidase [Nitrospirota bacterium]